MTWVLTHAFVYVFNSRREKKKTKQDTEPRRHNPKPYQNKDHKIVSKDLLSTAVDAGNTYGLKLQSHLRKELRRKGKQQHERSSATGLWISLAYSSITLLTLKQAVLWVSSYGNYLFWKLKMFVSNAASKPPVRVSYSHKTRRSRFGCGGDMNE